MTDSTVHDPVHNPIHAPCHSTGAVFSLDEIRSSIVPATHVLSNGRYTAVITAAGNGYSAYDGLALTRWVPDRTHDALGCFAYVRDEDSNDVWSASLSPVRREPDTYVARFDCGYALLERSDAGIRTRTEVCVAPESNVEIRRLTLTNDATHTRRLSVTVYAEAVLNDPAADAGHPAFSKLFVQTEITADGCGLIAKRRLRGASDAPLYVVTKLVGAGDFAGLESDRARFIGRGQSLAAPSALNAGQRLSCAVGNVLDPVLALRRVMTIGPGASAQLVWLLGAGAELSETESAVEDALEAVETGMQHVFDAAAHRAALVLGSAQHSQRFHIAVGAAIYGSPRRPPRIRSRDVADTDASIWIEAQSILAPGGDESFARTTAANRWAAPTRVASGTHARPNEGEPLLFPNGYGGFTADGTEYVIRVGGGNALHLPPQPWVNVIANERVGFIASERGAGFTWCLNSRLNRLTPWSNDTVTDPQNEALYLRDDDTGEVWSPTPGPIAGDGIYEVRHGFGYTTYTHDRESLTEHTTVFVPRSDPLKLARIRVTNQGPTARRVSVYSYSQLVLGSSAWDTAPHVRTAASDDHVILAVNERAGVFSSLVAFAAVVAPGDVTAISSCSDRRAFLGAYGSAEAPAALAMGASLDNAASGSGDHCAAFRLQLFVEPGATSECAFMLGQATGTAEADSLVRKYRKPGAVQAALHEAIEFWRDLLGGVRVETPSPAIDLMMNGWLAYQNLSCRMWGRSAFYQSGGAFGFRDQLQDAAALVHLAPRRTREQILLHAAHQFVEGDVLHWWHPPASEGIRTHFSDDLLWLPYVTAHYVATTGDRAVLDELVPFVSGPELERGEDEVFLRPVTGVAPASLYEHCCRALDRSLTAGPHGLPLMGTGDWNDGMNRVGREGRGESVWLGFFLSQIIGDFAPLCDARGDTARAARYAAFRNVLDVALNDAGWDGRWYRRAYYDDGTPLGSASAEECQIDAIAQAWAVISGVAPPARAAQAIDAMEAQLVAERDGIIRLLTPPFDRTSHDPGYIKGYLPGVRENGGQYTHAALWAVKALAELGRHERAASLLEMLSPVTRGGSVDAVATYQVEPYAIAADVYGVAPHVGRGGWTWYTGSAGWMYRVALESVLGIEVEGGDTISIRPCIPDSWAGFTVRYRASDGRTVYEIVVTRTVAGAPTSAVLNGIKRGVAVVNGVTRVALVRDGHRHRVDVSIGRDVRARYEERNEAREPSAERSGVNG
ncbi:MAG: glycosyl transferase [Gemmatimonadota bacterium]|nr:glycosyl transferase [Gemmatimonadota bacterium]